MFFVLGNQKHWNVVLLSPENPVHPRPSQKVWLVLFYFPGDIGYPNRQI